MLGSPNRNPSVTGEADSSQLQSESRASVTKLGGTAECLLAFRPRVDGRFFVLLITVLENFNQFPMSSDGGSYVRQVE